MTAEPDDLDDLKRSIDLPALLTNYGVELKQQGPSYIACCIWHDDHDPSMSVFMGDERFWRVHCHSCGEGGSAIDVVMRMDCCDTADAITRLRANHFVRDDSRILSQKTIVPNRWKNYPAPEPLTDFSLPELTYVAHWEYRDQANALLGYVVRYIDANGRKEYRPWTFGAMSDNMTPKWTCKTFANPRPLYGLHKLDKPGKILLGEGEKKTDAAQKLLPGMISIGWPGGANAIKYIDWSPLAGRNVLLVPDADIAGEKAMYDAARYLLAIGCTVRYLDTSDQPKGWDLADALEDEWTLDDIKTFCGERITTLTSRELDERKLSDEKKNRGK